MAAFIDKLFNKSQADAIRKLWEDTSSRSLLQKEIGKELLNTDQIINELPLTQIMFMMSLSPFANSEKECFDVAEIVYWGIEKNDVLPLVTKHNKQELAYRCLISLSLFKKVMIKKYERYGSPSPDFYRNVGIQSFSLIGKQDISSHFCKWESFIGEMLAS